MSCEVVVLWLFKVRDVSILPCFSCSAGWFVIFVAVMDESLSSERVVVAGCAGVRRTKYMKPRSETEIVGTFE
jgi:hypothetical protein